MKHFHGMVFILVFLFCLMPVVPGFAQQDTPPTPEKTVSQPKAREPIQWLSPEQAKKSRTRPRKAAQKFRRQWCLNEEGFLNVVLSDKTICGCLTKTHAVEFPSEKNWAEALGRVLYLALMTDRAPGLVVFHEPEQPPRYLLLLDTLIKNYQLPVTIWKQEVEFEKAAAPPQPEPSQQSAPGHSEHQEEDVIPFMLNKPQIEP